MVEQRELSGAGKWDSHYRFAPPYFVPYGESRAYTIAADLMKDCASVEDWGCGLGWFRVQLSLASPDTPYLGIDGSCSPHADVVEDLMLRETSAEGIFMRAVLEHNYDWDRILVNAAHSFTKVLVIALFTPWTDESPHEELRYEDDYGVPTLSLNRDAFSELLGLPFEEYEIASPNTAYGFETMIVVDRRG